MAEQKPRTKIPDSEIRIENIIQGSPIYIPYNRVTPKNKGKGKGSKNIKINDNSSSNEMARMRRRPRQNKENINIRSVTKGP